MLFTHIHICICCYLLWQNAWFQKWTVEPATLIMERDIGLIIVAVNQHAQLCIVFSIHRSWTESRFTLRSEILLHILPSVYQYINQNSTAVDNRQALRLYHDWSLKSKITKHNITGKIIIIIIVWWPNIHCQYLQSCIIVFGVTNWVKRWATIDK